MEHPGNMMPNGLAMPSMNRMQQPQPGNLNQQLHGRILKDIQNTLPGLPQGWQQTFDIRERANRVVQL